MSKRRIKSSNVNQNGLKNRIKTLMDRTSRYDLNAKDMT